MDARKTDPLDSLTLLQQDCLAILFAQGKKAVQENLQVSPTTLLIRQKPVLVKALIAEKCTSAEFVKRVHSKVAETKADCAMTLLEGMDVPLSGDKNLDFELAKNNPDARPVLVVIIERRGVDYILCHLPIKKIGDRLSTGDPEVHTATRAEMQGELVKLLDTAPEPEINKPAAEDAKDFYHYTAPYTNTVH